MIAVKKEVGDSLAPMVGELHIDQNMPMPCTGQRALEAQQPDEKSSSCDGSSNFQSDELTDPLQIYEEILDISGGVPPRFFDRFVGGGGFYEFPEDDIELLDWCWEPSRWRGAGSKSYRTEIYEVQVEAESVTVKECLELLKGIGRFIACSVESDDLFFAELNKDGAARLKGSNGIRDVYRHGDIFIRIKRS